MPCYKDISVFGVGKLWVVSSGWHSPTYSLTDGENEYGTIYHEGKSPSTSILETATATLAAVGAANGDITLKSAEGKIIGHAGTALFKRGLCLTLNNGLTATLSQPAKQNSNWAWLGTDGNCLIQVEGNIQLSLIFCCEGHSLTTPDLLALLFSTVKYLCYLQANNN